MPLTGSLVAANLGYRMIHRFGREIQQECEGVVKASEAAGAVSAARPKDAEGQTALR